jgi:hypothetical protein
MNIYDDDPNANVPYADRIGLPANMLREERGLFKDEYEDDLRDVYGTSNLPPLDREDDR